MLPRCRSTPAQATAAAAAAAAVCTTTTTTTSSSSSSSGGGLPPGRSGKRHCNTKSSTAVVGRQQRQRCRSATATNAGKQQQLLTSTQSTKGDSTSTATRDCAGGGGGAAKNVLYPLKCSSHLESTTELLLEDSNDDEEEPQPYHSYCSSSSSGSNIEMISENSENSCTLNEALGQLDDLTTSRAKKRNRKNISEVHDAGRPWKKQNKRLSEVRSGPGSSNSAATQSPTTDASTTAFDDEQENNTVLQPPSVDANVGTTTIADGDSLSAVDAVLWMGLEDLVESDLINTGTGNIRAATSRGDDSRSGYSDGVDEAVVVVGTPVSNNCTGNRKVIYSGTDGSCRSSSALRDNPWGLSPTGTGGDTTRSGGCVADVTTRCSVDWLLDNSLGSSSMACTPRPVPIVPRPSLPPLSPTATGSARVQITGLLPLPMIRAAASVGAGGSTTPTVGSGRSNNTRVATVDHRSSSGGDMEAEECSSVLPVAVCCSSSGTTHSSSAVPTTAEKSKCSLVAVSPGGSTSGGERHLMDGGDILVFVNGATSGGGVCRWNGRSSGRRSSSADGNIEMSSRLTASTEWSCDDNANTTTAAVGGGNTGCGLLKTFNNNISCDTKNTTVGTALHHHTTTKSGLKDFKRFSVCGIIGNDILYDGAGFDCQAHIAKVAATTNRRTSVDALREVTSVAGWEEEFLDSQVESPKLWSPTRPSQVMAPDPRWKYRACEKKLQARLRAVADGDNYKSSATTGGGVNNGNGGCDLLGPIAASHDTGAPNGINGSSSHNTVNNSHTTGGVNSHTFCNNPASNASIPVAVDVVMRTPTRG